MAGVKFRYRELVQSFFFLSSTIEICWLLSLLGISISPISGMFGESALSSLSDLEPFPCLSLSTLVRGLKESLLLTLSLTVSLSNITGVQLVLELF